MKSKVVAFQDGYARILINPDISVLSNLQAAAVPFLVDPDLSAVKDLSPELWKLVGVNILPMSVEEQATRLEEPGLNETFGPIFITKEVIKEIIKEVPVDRIVEVPVEVIKEVEVERIEIREIEKLVPQFITEYIEVPVEVIEEVIVEKRVEVPVEVIKEVIKEVPVRYEVTIREKYIPVWAYLALAGSILQLLMRLI